MIPKRKNNLLVRLSEGQYSSRYQSSEMAGKSISYIGDGNGILNRYSAVFDSSISYIDTAMHYRYFIKFNPVTNYDRNILNQSLPDGSDLYGEVIFKDGKYNVRKGTSDSQGKVSLE